MSGDDTTMVVSYGFFVLEVVKAWVDTTVKTLERFIISVGATSW